MTSTPTQHARVHGYLFIAMDDDDCGNPEFCHDRDAVLEAVKRSCFSNPESLDADHLRQCEGITDSLIEDGFFNFEGDPPLHLYKLHAPAQASGLRFPTSLRKMWSGTEVQAWLDQQGEVIRLSDIPEGCTPTDARVLREANRRLAEQCEALRSGNQTPAAPTLERYAISALRRLKLWHDHYGDTPIPKEVHDLVDAVLLAVEQRDFLQKKAARDLTGAQIDTLVALVEHGPLWDGDVPSKCGRDDLIAAGLAARVVVNGEDGYTAATYSGRDAYKAQFGAAQGGVADTINEAKANRLARRAINGAQHG